MALENDELTHDARTTTHVDAARVDLVDLAAATPCATRRPHGGARAPVFFTLGKQMFLRLTAAALLVSAGARGAAGATFSRAWSSGGAGTDASVRAAAAFMSAHLLPFGYDLAIVDGPWASSTDVWARPVPDISLFPSSASGDGLSSLSAHMAALGVRLGVWTLRGIPAAAVAARAPIYGSAFTADEAARLDQNCSAGGGNVGVRDNAAGRAYYASLAALYAGWGVVYVRADCFVGVRGTYDEDLRAFSRAMAAAGVAVGTSPGAALTVANATAIARGALAVAFRVSDGLSDAWLDAGGGATGVKRRLRDFAPFAALAGVNGAFSDGGALPVGAVRGAAGAPPAPTRLSRDEQTFAVTLWAVARAPLVVGGALPLDARDDFTLGLLTNAGVLAVHNATRGGAPVRANGAPPGGAGDAHAWAAAPLGRADAAVVALFNAGDAPATVSVDLADAHLSPTEAYCVEDVWARAARGKAARAVAAELRPHAAALLLLAPCAAGA